MDRHKHNFFFNLLSGIFAGCFVCSLIQYALLPCLTSIPKHVEGTGYMGKRELLFENSALKNGAGQIGHHQQSDITTDSNLILVGVMTARIFLSTRVLAAYNTWVKTIPGRVIFFSSEGSEHYAPPGVHVVGLPGVDDSYPPQKKSFMMLKYLHDHYLNDYRFFMRTDDDVYVKGETLARLLHSINSTRALFIGQAGLGKKEEYGMMNLKTMENFCMGGPGVILTRSTLKRLKPHIGHCLANVFTTHEDVEVGRCVSRYAKVSCTWAYEMQKILYNNYKEPNGSFSHSLKDTGIHNAATLHPVKNPAYEYRIDQYFTSRRAYLLRNELGRLQREINQINEILQDRDEFYSPKFVGMSPSLMKSVPKFRDEVLEWDFLAKSVYSARHVNPRHGYESDFKVVLDDVIGQVMEIINQNARQRGRSIEYREMLYGYHRVNPLHGADFILDLLLVYKKFQGKRKMTVPVRRHAYVQQMFLDVEFIEDDGYNLFTFSNSKETAPSSNAPASIAGGIFDTIQRKIGLGTASDNARTTGSGKDVVINFVLPLSGRYKTFLQFMHNFEDVCLKRNERVSLAVMLYRSEQDDRTDDMMSYVNTLKQKYPNHRLVAVEMPGMFSRGVALQHGSTLYNAEDLLFFIDVDMYMHPSTLQRIRINTVYGHQVYFPIVFSQYDPQYVCEKGNTSCPLRTSPFQFDIQYGYWRQFGYGIVAMYNGDLKRVGGFDLEIKGWGKEDIDLLQKFVNFNVTVFRAVDTGLVHIFHSIICDPSLDPAQYQMCLGSKAASYASTEKLSNIVYKTPEIYHRHELPDKMAIASE